MALTNFYLIAGGTGSADINAGSSIGAAQAAPTTGGSWTNATNTYVATGGTPFATTVAGDYVSVYADGATVTTYVAKVTTVVSNVSVILDGTIKYGTAPTDGAANRSAVAGGSWNTEQVLAAGGLATTTAPQPTKINIKGNLTLTTNRTISMAGSTTNPLWFSCYNTTPGDLDNDTTNSLAKPIWTLNSTFTLSTSGAHTIWSSLSVTGSRSGTVWTGSGNPCTFVRCRSTNSSGNAAAVAFISTGGSSQVYYCYFLAPSTATTTGVVQATGTSQFIGCVFDTGGLAGLNMAAQTIDVVACNFVACVGAGILSTTGILRCVNSTFYGCTVDGIKWTGTPGVGYVVGCLLSGLNGGSATTNGINNASGTNTSNVRRSCNDYYNVTNAEVGFGDNPSWFGQTDSNPVVTTTVTDMTPVAGSNARNNGFPGIFEAQTYNSYPDIGAVRHADPASGGSVSQVFGG